MMQDFKSDATLTVDEFVEKYTSGSSSIGNTEEIKLYLKMRHRYFNGLCDWHEVIAAYRNTGLERKK